MCNAEITQDKGIEIECFLATEHKEDSIINHYTKNIGNYKISFSWDN